MWQVNTDNSYSTTDMQAQLTKTQQVFSIISSNGPISAKAIASKAGITYRQAYKVTENLSGRKNPLVRKLTNAFGNVQFAATVAKEQAVFQQPKVKLSIKQQIYKLIESTSTLNPTEVTEKLNGPSYKTVARSMAYMVEDGIMSKDGFQYAIVPGMYDKLYSGKGRPRKA